MLPGQLVRRRDLHKGRRAMDSSLWAVDQAWPGHRRHAAGQARPGRRSAIPHPGAARPALSRPRSPPTAPVCPRVLDGLVPSALHTVEQHANNPTEADHGRLKARLRPTHGMKRQRSVRVLSRGTGLAAEPAPRPLRPRHGDSERPPAAPSSATSPSPSEPARHRDYAPVSQRDNATVPFTVSSPDCHSRVSSS
jgi:hypothetical protein